VTLLIRIEENIRDWLAEHLDFIAPNLRLVRKEYPLPNPFGSRGRIDILAVDDHNNFVVIEVKRSDQAAREALHEIHKYIGLLKHDLGARDSEFRIMIVSSEWAELIVPFSEFVSKTLYAFEGYQIQLDSTNVPTEIKRVEPLDQALARKISPVQDVLLYTSQASLNRGLQELRECASALGLENYVAVEMHTTRGIPYPFAIWIAIHQHTEEAYLRMLQNHPDLLEEVELVREEEDDESVIRTLEENILSELARAHHDTLEIGSPEKFDSELDRWTIPRIDKNGLFARDPRLTNEMLLHEIKGLDGTHSAKYRNLASSRYPLRIQEIRKSVQNSLYFASPWATHIDSVIAEAIAGMEPFELSVQTYCPANIIETFWLLVTAQIQEEYLPMYVLQLDFADRIEIHFGHIAWNGQDQNFREVMRRFFQDDPRHYLTSRMLHSIQRQDQEIMASLGLRYVTGMQITRGGEITSVQRITDKNLEGFLWGLGDFILNVPEFMGPLLAFYDENVYIVQSP
jgi:hypothetical protein